MESKKRIKKTMEEEMYDLNDTIFYGGDFDTKTNNKQLDNLIDKYVDTQYYISHNDKNLSHRELENLEQRQEERKKQMDIMS